MARFLVDAQLPPSLCLWLADQGHEARHVADLGLASASDAAVWARATLDEAILLTKDEDFVALRQGADDGPAVCWLRIGNATNPGLIEWLSKVFPDVLAALAAGETVIEVR